jgi:urea transport system permease protein
VLCIALAHGSLWCIDTHTLTILLIYGMLALSLGLVWGFGGILCFGQAAFYGLGAYAYAVSALNLSANQPCH